MNYLLLVACLLIPITSAIESSISCPAKVSVDEEFICEVTSTDVQSPHDLKIELVDQGKTIARIFNPAKDKWTSAYYYLPGFIDESGTKAVQLKIESEGSFTGVLKARGSAPLTLATFEIQVGESNMQENKKDEIKNDEEKKKPVKEKITNNNEPPVAIKFDEISLGEATPPVSETVREVTVYESKNQKILQIAPYVFSLFLLIVLVAFAIKR